MAKATVQVSLKDMDWGRAAIARIAELEDAAAELRDCLRHVEAIRLAHRSLPDDTSVEEIARVLSGFAPARDALEDAVSDFLAAVDGETPAT